MPHKADPQDLSAWLTKEQAAEQLQTSISSVERMQKKGELEFTHRPRPGLKPETVYSPADIDRKKPVPSTPAFLTPPDTKAVTLAAAPHAAIAPIVAALQQAFAPRPPQKFLTLQAAAIETGLSVRYLRGRIRAGELPAIRDGRVRKVRAQDLAKL